MPAHAFEVRIGQREDAGRWILCRERTQPRIDVVRHVKQVRSHVRQFLVIILWSVETNAASRSEIAGLFCNFRRVCSIDGGIQPSTHHEPLERIRESSARDEWRLFVLEGTRFHGVHQSHLMGVNGAAARLAAFSVSA